MTNARHDTAREIHTLRYGEDLLPEGHLDRAAALHSGDGELLKIYTAQEKSIYLRGFIGADYQDGVWTLPADAAYGGDYAGMMRWLNEQGFDPLTQVADYYTLSDPDDSPEGNQLTVEVPGAARCYIYAPAGTDAASAARFAEKIKLATFFATFPKIGLPNGYQHNFSAAKNMIIRSFYKIYISFSP